MPKTSLGDVPEMALPSRSVAEVASGSVMDTTQTTLRIVELHPAAESEPRHPHRHEHMEEVVHVLEGSGKTWIEGEVFEVTAGDTILYPIGQRHMTVNTGTEPLRLACFFPVPDIERDFVVDETTTFPEDEL